MKIVVSIETGVLGDERVGKVLPAAERLCPKDVIRNGERV